MDPVILGNLFSVLATGTDVWSTFCKSAKRMLGAQTIGQVFLSLSSFVLGGYSAVVQNVVSIVRNLTALADKSSKLFEYILIILGVVLGFVFNNLGWLGWLPILANLEYSIAIFRFKSNERMLKAAFALCVTLYTVFNFAIRNYVGVVSNIAVLTTALLSIFKKAKA